MAFPNIRWLLELITRVHRFIYRKTDGRIGARIFSMHFLLLTHVGRRSGLERTTPLLCIAEENRWIVVGSNAGDDRTPAWWLNLQSHPEAHVQLGRERAAVKARQATDAEHQTLWTKLQASYPYYDDYLKRTDREIPVVVMERCAG